MITDIKSKVDYKLYESGVITATLSGRGNRKATGGKSLGRKQKKFIIDKKIVRSTIIRQFNLKKNTIKFVTLTFPQDVENKFANECFSKFIENLKENYKLQSYIAIKELTKIGRPHFHIFLDMPYINYSRINRAWCFTFFPIIPYSKNAVTTRKGKSIIRNIKRCVHYASKYVTKPEDYLNNAEYKISSEQFIDFITNRSFFCDRSILSKGYIILSGLMDYLLHIGQAVLFVDKDYFQVFGLKKFTPNLYNMSKYVKNYCLFVLYFKIKRPLTLFFSVFFLTLSKIVINFVNYFQVKNRIFIKKF